jgi:hypothetical protein
VTSGPLNRAAYRVRQFGGALRPRLADSERDEAEAVLGDRLIQAFDSMPLRDRRHCFDVYQTLKRNGSSDPDLLTAALLHDAGKGSPAGARIRLWHRVAYVLLAAGDPRALTRLADGRGGLAALHHHSERGARLAQELGASPAVVDLIAHHEDRGHDDERHRLLRAADDAC